MKDQDSIANKDLPEIPDYPDSPLPAWKHYGIAYYVGWRIMRELEGSQYAGDMVGLEFAYVLGEEKRYKMNFGKVDLQADALKENEHDRELPLSDDFLMDLYQTVIELMAANAPDYAEQLTAELTIVITGSYTCIKVSCRVPQICNLNHTDKRWCKQVNYGSWVCLHTKCR